MDSSGQPLMSGVLQSGQLTAIMQAVFHPLAYSGTLVIFAPGRSGQVYYQAGEIIHASDHVTSGLTALTHLLALREGEYQFWAGEPEVRRTIHTPHAELFQVRQTDGKPPQRARAEPLPVNVPPTQVLKSEPNPLPINSVEIPTAEPITAEPVAVSAPPLPVPVPPTPMPGQPSQPSVPSLIPVPSTVEATSPQQFTAPGNTSPDLSPGPSVPGATDTPVSVVRPVGRPVNPQLQPVALALTPGILPQATADNGLTPALQRAKNALITSISQVKGQSARPAPESQPITPETNMTPPVGEGRHDDPRVLPAEYLQALRSVLIELAGPIGKILPGFAARSLGAELNDEGTTVQVSQHQEFMEVIRQRLPQELHQEFNLQIEHLQKTYRDGFPT